LRVVILASGRGARFAPLTDYLPKPLLPAANRPLLAHLLHTLTAAGLTQAIVTTGHLASQVEQFLATETPPTIRATAVRAPHWQRGPAASLSSALPYLEEDTPFLLLPADLHLPPQALKLLLQREEEFTLLYDPNPSPPTGPGHHNSTALLIDSTHTVTGLFPQQEAPANALPCLPVIRVTPRLLQLKRWGKNPPATVRELLQHIIAAGHRPCGLPLSKGPWFDVDTPQDLLQLNSHLLTAGWPPLPNLPHGSIHLPYGDTLTGPLRTPALTLGPHTRLDGPLLLGPHVHIGSHVHITKSTLAPQTTVHDGARIINAITLPHTRIRAGANIHDQIVYHDGKTLK